MKIRLAEPEDAAGILAIYAPVVRETAISFELEPPAEEEMRRRVASTLERRPWLVSEADGAVAGYAYAAAHRERAAYQWSVETSVYVHSDYRRCGVARGLYTALLAALRVQGFANALAGITLPNPASTGFHESCGFEWIGVYRAVGYKLGAGHDVGWLQLRLREDRGAPAGPPCHGGAHREAGMAGGATIECAPPPASSDPPARRGARARSPCSQPQRDGSGRKRESVLGRLAAKRACATPRQRGKHCFGASALGQCRAR